MKITISVISDYFPYGKIVREFEMEQERYLTTQHERDEETGLDYRGARYYDSDIARFLSLDPLANEYPSLCDYSYVAGNPIIYIDPTGKAVETKFVDRTGKVLADIDDGSDEIYVVYQDNKESLLRDLLGNINGSFSILDKEINAELGKKYGFNLSELADRSSPEFGYQDPDSQLGHLFQSGYNETYAKGKFIDTHFGFLTENKEGGTAYLWGRDAGSRDVEIGNMNTFKPEIKDNTPFLAVSVDKKQNDVKMKVFGIERTREDFENWINRYYK